MWINGVHFKDNMDVLVIIDHMNLLTNKKITEEGQNNLEKLQKLFEKYQIKIKLTNTETL